MDVRDALVAVDVTEVGGTWPAAELVLFESRLGRPHAEYVSRARFLLPSC
jgi:hypothetical protein